MIALQNKSTAKKNEIHPNVALMHKISLRQRKHAQTKVSLARAAMERMREKRLEDISVRELCETIPISEVTFYNYFPQKTDLLSYIMMLWQLEMIWDLQNQEGEKSNLEIIESFFDSASQTFEEFPSVMNEALAFFLQQRGEIHWGEMSVAEKLIAYPELIGIEHIKLPRNPKEDRALVPYIEMALEAGELPQSTDVEELSRMLDTVLIGALMALCEKNFPDIKTMYRKMLKILWQGLRADLLGDDYAEQVN